MIINNDALVCLTGLTNLTSINGHIIIGGGRWNGNDLLTSLSGLENINAGTIESLTIINNSSLSTCEVQSICDYLAMVSPYAPPVYIEANAPGCSSQQEVEDACEAVDVADIIFNTTFSIYPNPATNEVFISTNNDVIIEEVNIYNQFGQNIIHKSFSLNMIDVSLLQEGIYVLELVSDELKIREKLIIE